MVLCFLDFLDIKKDPKKTQYALTDRLMFVQQAKSESQSALRCISEVDKMN